MRASAWFVVTILGAQLSGPICAQPTDGDSLRVYAVNIVKTAPFKPPFTGDGVYLGRGMVLTAAHVVGHWPLITRPRVLIAGQDLPAKVLKEGSFETIDLALLSIDKARLPVSLLLRRNPLCKEAPKIGMEAVNVVPDKTIPSRIISPSLIPANLRTRFDTLIDGPKASGSGLFDAERKCLLGIMSARVAKFRYQKRNGRIIVLPDGFAGYFVSAQKIADFIPSDITY